jgi:hypothetical protein
MMTGSIMSSTSGGGTVERASSPHPTASTSATPTPPRSSAQPPTKPTPAPRSAQPAPPGTALAVLATRAVGGRAPKTGYGRDRFGPAWTDDVNVPDGHNGCDTQTTSCAAT